MRLSIGRIGQMLGQRPGRVVHRHHKGELLDHRSWQYHSTARAAIFDYIEDWYSTTRRHSTLDYHRPRGGLTDTTNVSEKWVRSRPEPGAVG